jgi:putative transposase
MAAKTLKYRISPNKATAEKLQWTLDRCRELYNAALDERKSAYRVTRKIPVEFCGDVALINAAAATGLSIGYNQQQNDLPEIKEMRPEYKEIGSHVLQNVLKRVDLALAGFFSQRQNASACRRNDQDGDHQKRGRALLCGPCL